MVLAALAARCPGLAPACCIIGANRPCPAVVIELHLTAPRPRSRAAAVTAAAATAAATAATAAATTAAAATSIDALQGAQEPGSRGGEPAPLSEAIVERAVDEAVAEEAEEEAEEEAAEVLEEAVEVAAEVAEMEAAVWIAVAEANASVPSYSRVPPRLVWLLHPEQESLYLLRLYLLWLY